VRRQLQEQNRLLRQQNNALENLRWDAFEERQRQDAARMYEDLERQRRDTTPR